MVNLKRLIDKTREIELQVDSKHNRDHLFEYTTVDSGTFIGFGLHKEPVVAVQRVFMSKGTKIPEHNHPEKEYCIVYVGAFELYKQPSFGFLKDGKSTRDMKKPNRVVGVGDGVYFPPNEPHGGIMLEDTWIIGITIPASEEYPDA